MPQTVASTNRVLQGVTTEFFEDGSCASSFPGEDEPVAGKYRFEDNYGTLITSYTTTPEENPSKILKRTNSEMVLETEDLIYYMTK